ncbi:MAG: nucleoside-diphosphate kinase [Chloroflexi bacterium]|nr:nucleoside-diphosphate kinase [Chloroflexota bacterium]
MERTLVLLKPDAVQRALVGRLIARFEEKGLRLAGLKLFWVDEGLAGRLYETHRGKDFYPGLMRFITSGPIVALALEGRQAVAVVRRLIGETDAAVASSGTIRGDWAIDNRRNLVHASDSPETAQRELGLFFRPEELVSYKRDFERWLIES